MKQHRELDMYKLQEIIEALINKVPIKSIARLSKVSKNTIKKYRNILQKIISTYPKKRNDIVFIMKEFKSARKIERYSENFGWLEKNTSLLEDLSIKCENYSRLIEVLQEKGFIGSYSSLLRFLNTHNFNSEKPIVRIETKPGEIAQVDFGSIGKIYNEKTKQIVKAYVFVMVLGFSRHAYYEIVTSQNIETWCNCHIHAFEYFGGIPRIIIPDNLKSAIIKASFLNPIANRSYADLAKHYGFQIDPCLPGTPNHKGKVESGVKYVKNNFLPLRSFINVFDANQQLYEWNEQKAKVRIHGTTRRKPIELFEVYETSCLKALPLERCEISIWKELKVYGDIHIQFDNAYYSVPYEHKGEYVLARKTASQVAILHENEVIAVHMPVGKGKRSTNYDHYPPDKIRFMKQDTNYCLKQASLIGESTHTIVNHLLNEEPIRNLRGAQNIIRMKKRYGAHRLEEACKRALLFSNYDYYTIKNILDKGMDNQLFFFSEDMHKNLDASYAKNINSFLQEVLKNGNKSTTEN